MDDQRYSTPPTHVSVPLAWFNEVLEVYYAAQRDDLVARKEVAPPPESPAVERVEPLMPTQMRFIEGFGQPVGGYTPMGAAKPPAEPEDAE